MHSLLPLPHEKYEKPEFLPEDRGNEFELENKAINNKRTNHISAVFEPKAKEHAITETRSYYAAYYGRRRCPALRGWLDEEKVIITDERMLVYNTSKKRSFLLQINTSIYKTSCKYYQNSQ